MDEPMDAAGTHLSRHFLSFQPARVRQLPFAPPGAADAEGVQLAHKLLVLGNWNEDDEVRAARAGASAPLAYRQPADTRGALAASPSTS